jgi:hypothetical protein
MVRSRISFCAASGSFQRAESSAFAFSSARRRVEASTSKMPPQQPHGLLDGFDELLGFGAHEGSGTEAKRRSTTLISGAPGPSATLNRGRVQAASMQPSWKGGRQ